MVAIVVSSSHLLHLYGVGWQAIRGIRLAAHIELKNTWNHNDRLRPISILEHCELEGFCAIDKKSAAVALIVLDYPIAPAVFSDQEERRSSTRLRRGRFRMFHGTSP
jgi:hypothetical protein